MTVTVPLIDLAAAHAEIAEEVHDGFERVIANAAFIHGAEVTAFEEEYAAFCATAHCVSLANGTDAVELALRAIGIGPGSQVVLPANTFTATAGAVMRIGAQPVPCDVTPDSLLIDPAAIPPWADAIIAVHLYGRPAPMQAILAAAGDIPVVEDAAQFHSAAPTIRGTVAATSFYPGKNLGAYGDAGAIITDNPELARHVRLLANHGSERKYEHLMPGFNSRLDTLQAVVLRAKLRRLNAANQARRAAAGRYNELLAGLPIRLPEITPQDVWHQYVIRVHERDAVAAGLDKLGVQTGVHYPKPIHLLPAYAHLGYGPGDFPVAEAAATQVLSLPMHPHLTEEQQRYVADALHRVLWTAHAYRSR
ncbi:DegT/DnrJ/EryC1/StrS family aminotransferase [Nonomuraea sp. NPDC049400]|uniref:DegT/DnrJ/EryC1/StrS family aminotransferase n=1 Tax=Nonomuraea sp. NPDC049400 TaxID=3364352 RepID=UPI0037AEFE80